MQTGAGCCCTQRAHFELAVITGINFNLQFIFLRDIIMYRKADRIQTQGDGQMNTSTIETNHWTNEMETWAPNGNVWSTENEAESIKQIAYFRMAYPMSSFSLQCNGWIVSTKELSEMAKHLLS